MKIPIKRYVMDESLSWEERYRKLEAHHEEETKYLISVMDLAKQKLQDYLGEESGADVDTKVWEANMAAHRVLSGADKPGQG